MIATHAELVETKGVEPESLEHSQVGALLRWQDRLCYAQGRDQPHLFDALDRRRTWFRDISPVCLRGEIANAKPAKMMCGANEPVEIRFDQIRVHDV